MKVVGNYNYYVYYVFYVDCVMILDVVVFDGVGKWVYILFGWFSWYYIEMFVD